MPPCVETSSRRGFMRFAPFLLGAVVTACSSTNARRGAVADAEGTAGRSETPLFARIDHFYATSPTAETQFNFFRDTLGLAVSWPFKSYGEFASGGLSLGNTVLELVTETVPPGDTLHTEWKSLAFEPVGDTEAALAELARRGISHSPPDVTRFRDANGQDVVGWTNTSLTGLTPSDVAFICDYANRRAVQESRQAGRDELARRRGGPLGVIRLKEIVIGVTDLAAASDQWRRLLAQPGEESNGLFHFGDGPSIRLVPSGKGGIREIAIAVRSLTDARRFLEERGLLDIGGDSQLRIAPRAIGGLQVRLVVD